jgi:hypothetical protein
MRALWLHYDERDDEIICENTEGMFGWNFLSWESFDRIQDIFVEISGQWQEQTLCKTMSLVTSLKDLDFFD